MPLREEDIERLLREEIREKKRAGVGVFSRASRRGLVGTMIMPKDKKARRTITLSEYNMYDLDHAIPIATLRNTMSKENAREYLQRMRTTYTVDQLVRAYGLPNKGELYKWFKEFNVPNKRNVNQSKRRKTETKEPTKLSSFAQEQEPRLMFEEPKSVLKIMLSGDFTGAELSERLNDICLLVADDRTYSIDFIITEGESAQKQTAELDQVLEISVDKDGSAGVE